MTATCPDRHADGAPRVCAAIITCQPDVRQLEVSVDAISRQVAEVLIIDNATRDEGFARFLREVLPANATVIRNAVNEGLGAAINDAFEWAAVHECDFVLLLDQDSSMDARMVDRLLEASMQLSAQSPVAAVGPKYIDAHTGDAAPFVRLGFPFNRKIACPDDAAVECDFLISSGSLISLAAFRDVGAMDASLFIDNVDIEWCFRARRKGYRLFGVGAARMRHRIGDSVKKIPWFGNVVVHSPVRLYYMTRNRVLLYRRSGTPRVWIAQDMPRLLFKMFRFGLFITPRATNIRYMLAGLMDGWRGTSGPIGTGL
jgi:rhamnosyltransferase